MIAWQEASSKYIPTILPDGRQHIDLGLTDFSLTILGNKEIDKVIKKLAVLYANSMLRVIEQIISDRSLPPLNTELSQNLHALLVHNIHPQSFTLHQIETARELYSQLQKKNITPDTRSVRSAYRNCKIKTRHVESTFTAIPHGSILGGRIELNNYYRYPNSPEWEEPLLDIETLPPIPLWMKTLQDVIYTPLIEMSITDQPVRFISAIPSDIADKYTPRGFVEDTWSGAVLHGELTHLHQLRSAFRRGKISSQLYHYIVRSKLWNPIFDQALQRDKNFTPLTFALSCPHWVISCNHLFGNQPVNLHSRLICHDLSRALELIKSRVSEKRLSKIAKRLGLQTELNSCLLISQVIEQVGALEYITRAYTVENLKNSHPYTLHSVNELLSCPAFATAFSRFIHFPDGSFIDIREVRYHAAKSLLLSRGGKLFFIPDEAPNAHPVEATLDVLHSLHPNSIVGYIFEPTR